MPQAPVGSQAAQVSVAPQAGTSVNIAILDSKDFPGEVAPINELYSEFSMMDGTVLFECPGLMKATGIDLMNCPLSVVLQLRIRRRMPQGPLVLWHVVLPLPLISKHLMGPPYEWETWLGLLPNTQDLNSHPADMMFTQAVHLISRPEFPKLRLRFTYHNPQLQAQVHAQQEQQEQEDKKRREQTEHIGRAQFQDIHNLMRQVKSSGTSSASANAAAAAAAPPAPPNAGPVTVTMPAAASAPMHDPLRDSHAVAVTLPHHSGQLSQMLAQAQPPVAAVAWPVAVAAVPVAVVSQPVVPMTAQPAAPAAQHDGYSAASATGPGVSGPVIPPMPPPTMPSASAPAEMREERLREERLRDALAGSLRFVGDVRLAMASQLSKRPQAASELPSLPAQLDSMEVLRGDQSAVSLDSHCQQLRQCLQGLLAMPAAQAPAAAPSPSAEVEPLLVEGLRMAITGMLDDANACKDEVVFISIKERFPQFWDLCREVSSLASERGILDQQQRRTQEQCRYFQDQCSKLSQEREQLSKEKENQTESISRGETQKQFEKLLNQQRQALQTNFDSETSTLRNQLEDMRRTAQEREGEVAQLRAQLGDFMKSRQKT